jgi:putative endonuclease
MNILKILTEKRKTGNIGERAAAKMLRRTGHKILAKNYVSVGHEIDIIAADKFHTLFVEVKTRTLDENGECKVRPAASVTPEKQRAIIATAKAYLAYNRSNRRVRFDVVEVYLDKNKKVQKILHLKSAFNLNTSRGM